MKVFPLSEVKMKLSQLVEEVSSRDEEIAITRDVYNAYAHSRLTSTVHEEILCLPQRYSK